MDRTTNPFPSWLACHISPSQITSPTRGDVACNASNSALQAFTHAVQHSEPICHSQKEFHPHIFLHCIVHCLDLLAGNHTDRSNFDRHIFPLCRHFLGYLTLRNTFFNNWFNSNNHWLDKIITSCTNCCKPSNCRISIYLQHRNSKLFEMMHQVKSKSTVLIFS